jgi:DNA-binding PadR family transcriptional regulator
MYLAVLTLVGSGARYGYEIYKIMEDRNYASWVEIGETNKSSVYKSLSELEKRNLVKGQKRKKKVKQSKKIYKLTPKGRRVLKREIIRCLSDPPRAKSLFDLGLSAMFLLTKEEVIEALENYLKDLDNRIGFLFSNVEALKNLDEIQITDPNRQVADMKAKDVPEDTHLGIVLALFERPYVRAKAERDWLEQLISDIKKNKDGFHFKDKTKRNV